MLYFKTVEPDTLELLRRLMDRPYLSTFCLVGGTSLALQFGHRKSIDLDLFSETDFDDAEEDPPVLMKRKVTWPQVKKKILAAVASL